MTIEDISKTFAKNWREFCPELAKLEKTLAADTPSSPETEAPTHGAAYLNRWGDPDAHTLKWMEDQAIAQIRIGEELARIPTEDSSRIDSITSSLLKQEDDDDFVLDQGFSSGWTDRRLREQEREQISKAHSAANISLESEYMRRDSKGQTDGPLDMGFTTASRLDY